MDDSVHQKGCDNVCTRGTPPQDMRGSASPQGEARRACAAKRERSEARGGTLLTRVRVILKLRGGGWAGRMLPNQTFQPAQPTASPQQPLQIQIPIFPVS